MSQRNYDVTERPIASIRPYERNPRDNSKAVEKVARSIREFGWQQPIVVDDQGVVIAGHTRLEAAKQLGLDSVPVHTAEGLSADQVGEGGAIPTRALRIDVGAPDA
jgi:site-specific DNA-methyltransferase (adenine-specific)